MSSLEWPRITVKDARNEANRLRLVAEDWKAGGYSDPDPFAKVEPVKSAVPAFGELTETYITLHVREEATRPDKAEYNTRWMLKKYFAEWNDRAIDLTC